jgi:amino acid transporter
MSLKVFCPWGWLNLFGYIICLTSYAQGWSSYQKSFCGRGYANLGGKDFGTYV